MNKNATPSSQSKALFWILSSLPFILLVVTLDTTGSVGQRPITARSLYQATSPPPAEAPCKNVQIDHTEVTQSIQTDDNDVILIDGRRTAVRVYAKSSDGPCKADMYLNLTSTDARALPSGLPMKSKNGPLTLQTEVDLATARPDENGAFYFEFIPSESGGTNYTFIPIAKTFADETECIPSDTQDSTEYSRTFVEVCSPRILGVRVAFDFGDPFVETPVPPPDIDLVKPAKGDAALWGMYPFQEYPPDTIFSQWSGYYLHPDILTVTVAWPPGTDDPLQNDLWRWKFLRANPVPDFIIGWPLFSMDESNGEAPIDDNQSWALVFPDYRIHAEDASHEVGHNMGFGHNANVIDEVGWDVLNMVERGRIRTASAENRMKHASTAGVWLPVGDPDGYETVFNSPRGNLPPSVCEWETRNIRLIPVPRLPQPLPTWLPTSTPWNYATRTPSRPVPFSTPRPDPSFELSVMSRPFTITTEGRGRVDLVNDQEEVLYSTHYTPCYGGDCTEANVGVITPAYTTTQSIRFYLDDALQQIITRSIHSPEVTILGPAAESELTSTTAISWTMTDDDDDFLMAVPQYSPDGERWFGLTTPTTRTLVYFDPTTMPASEDAMIRVIGSDGINTTHEDVGSLTQPLNHYPLPFVLSPNSGETFKAGSNVPLLGTVQDVDEDDPWPSADIWWDSSRDGFIGIGSIVNTTKLSPGNHTITLHARDADDLVSTDSITVSILPMGFPGNEENCIPECTTPSATPSPTATPTATATPTFGAGAASPTPTPTPTCYAEYYGIAYPADCPTHTPTPTVTRTPTPFPTSYCSPYSMLKSRDVPPMAHGNGLGPSRAQTDGISRNLFGRIIKFLDLTPRTVWANSEEPDSIADTTKLYIPLANWYPVNDPKSSSTPSIPPSPIATLGTSWPTRTPNPAAQNIPETSLYASCIVGIREDVQSPVGTSSKIITTTYDGDGLPVIIAVDDEADGTIDSTSAYEWDTHGNLNLVQSDKDKDGIWDSQRTLTYTNGSQLTYVDTDINTHDRMIDYRWSYRYDESGHRIAFDTDYGLDGSVEKSERYAYDSEGQEIRNEADSNGDGSLDTLIFSSWLDRLLIEQRYRLLIGGAPERRYIFHYNDRRRVMREDSFSGEATSPSYWFLYYYDSRDLEIRFERWNKGDSDPTNWREKTYDASGRIVREITSAGSKTTRAYENHCP